MNDRSITLEDNSMLSDKELIDRNRSDGGYAAEIISRHIKLVFALAKKYSEYADHEELVSDGMEGLMSAVKSYNEEKGEFSAYAAVCIENRLKNTVKRSVNRAKRLAGEEELDTVADLKPTPEEEMIQREAGDDMIRTIEKELSELEFKCIKGVVMGLSYEELAEKLGVDKKSVDNALARARKKLRGIIKG